MENASKVKLMIAQDGILDTFTKHFSKSDYFEIVEKTNNGAELLKQIEENKPDIVVLDIILHGLDGFAILEKVAALETANWRPKMFVLSALSNETFINRAFSLGAAYYMVKPFDFDNLELRLRETHQSVFADARKLNTANLNFDVNAALTKTTTVKTKQLEEKISNIFITVGIPAHIKGYQFLREAIKMAIKDPDIINSITKRLYPSIAERFATSASKVERAIRHAIEVAWNRGKIENINSIFGVKVYSSNEKPTNGEFIALVADKMLIEGA